MDEFASWCALSEPVIRQVLAGGEEALGLPRGLLDEPVLARLHLRVVHREHVLGAHVVAARLAAFTRLPRRLCHAFARTTRTAS